ncbi:MAG: TIGR02680 family protein [Phycisphaeraceae bacterium]
MSVFTDSALTPEPQPTALPAATSRRWRPVRAGLLNIYRYDEQAFHFEQGRLLLRGNNGTGKSRVLAMQLPFLFDAEVLPHRVEPDGDAAKRIEWNLLMDRYPDRLGYTWLEFGRQDNDGQEHYLTLGIALHAVSGRGAPQRWHFITSLRVGRDLNLRNDRNLPLSQTALTEAIGDAGRVYDKSQAREYRRAVDDALFKLGEQRYQALMELLIQLRQPQLSRNLDEKRLSAALSEALPPVASRIIADVAESFRGLESDRLDLQRSEAAGEATETFLQKYGPYVRCAARRRAAAVRTAHAESEAAQRRLRGAEQQRDAAAASLQEVETRLNDLAGEIAAADARIQTLRESPEMRAAKDLDRAHREAEERNQALKQARDDHSEAARLHKQARDDEEEANQSAEQAGQAMKDAAVAATSAAHNASFDEQHVSAMAMVDHCDREGEPAESDTAAIEQAQRHVKYGVEQRQKAISHVATLVEAVREAESKLTSAKQWETHCQGQWDEAVNQQRITAEAVEAGGTALLAAYRTWHEGLSELSPCHADDLADDLAAWCETGAGSSPVRQAVDSAVARATQALVTERASLEQQLTHVGKQIAEWQEQRQALEAGKHEPPPRPHTRSVEARVEAQLGAPLWTIVDFVSDVPEEDQAGFEAALEASGILDAWLTPDGQLLDAATLDTCLLVTNEPLTDEVPRLTDVLHPDSAAVAASDIDEEIVRQVLAQIAISPDRGGTWVDASGAWQNGPLHGRWTKPAAQHIGQAARERHRLNQIAALDGQIEVGRQEERRQQAAVDELTRRIESAEQEAKRSPSDDDVRQSLAERAAAEKHVVACRKSVTAAEKQVHGCRRALAEAEALRDRDAADLGLTEWINRLDELRQALADYRQAMAALWPALRQRGEAVRRLRHCIERTCEATAKVDEHAQRVKGASEQAHAAEAHRDTLKASVGQSAQDIRVRLDKARQQADRLNQEQVEATNKRADHRADLARIAEKLKSETETLTRNQNERTAAMDALAGFIDTGLMPVVAGDLEGEGGQIGSVTRAVELSRRIESLLTDVPSDDQAWAKHQGEVFRHIQELTDKLLPHDLNPQSTMIHDMLVVTVVYNQQDCGMAELREALAEDAQARRTLLEERERQVLEQTLIDDVASHLHDRLHEAEGLVKHMNEQLSSRPMSTGMMLKFTWEPVDDGPPGLAEARKRLLGAGATWSDQQRAALGQFLHEQIQAVRAADETATWQQHIEQAFDYRRWHRFGVMRRQEDKWQRLTKRTHGTGSGGEKAVALTLPMFAAASAHYQSADPLAPRPILLDEVFAGIDSDMRGKCMGLLEAFDLDFIMTSEREWGCYAEMPGVAIYQLTTMKGNDGVLATRWLWNGQELQRSDATATDGRLATTTDGEQEVVQ